MRNDGYSIFEQILIIIIKDLTIKCIDVATSYIFEY